MRWVSEVSHVTLNVYIDMPCTCRIFTESKGIFESNVLANSMCLYLLRKSSWENSTEKAGQTEAKYENTSIKSQAL